MKRITISVEVDKVIAARAGKTRFGRTEYEPTEAELGELSADVRAWLAANDVLFRLDSPTVEWDAIVSAICARMAQDVAEKAERAARDAKAEKARAEREAEEKKQDDARVAELLAMPDWVLPPSDTRSNWCLATGVAFFADRPEIADRLRKAQAIVDERNAEIDRARTEARLAANARAEAGAIAYAKETDTLARPATEGYAVEDAVADHVANVVASCISGATILVEGTPQYDAAKWNERRAPNATAFAQLDRVNGFLKGVRVPDGWSVEAVRIMRVRLPVEQENPYTEKTEWKADNAMTAVLVFVESPLTKDRVVVIPAE